MRLDGAELSTELANRATPINRIMSLQDEEVNAITRAEVSSNITQVTFRILKTRERAIRCLFLLSS